jgi:hypothetical protein
MLPRRADSSHLPGASASPWPYENRSIRQAGVWAAFFESRWGQVFLFVAISDTNRARSTTVRDVTCGVVKVTCRGRLAVHPCSEMLGRQNLPLSKALLGELA